LLSQCFPRLWLICNCCFIDCIKILQSTFILSYIILFNISIQCIVYSFLPLIKFALNLLFSSFCKILWGLNLRQCFVIKVREDTFFFQGFGNGRVEVFRRRTFILVGISTPLVLFIFTTYALWFSVKQLFNINLSSYFFFFIFTLFVRLGILNLFFLKQIFNLVCFKNVIQIQFFHFFSFKFKTWKQR